jgi:hypothetical protein
MKKTASNANIAGWISSGFDNRTVSRQDFPEQKELLKHYESEGMEGVPRVLPE